MHSVNFVKNNFISPCQVFAAFKEMTRGQKKQQKKRIMHTHSKPDDSSFVSHNGIGHSFSVGPEEKIHTFSF